MESAWSIWNHHKFILFMAIFLTISILVVIAIFLDLWDGVHTAKATKEKIHSHKFRITLSKMSEYWRFIVIGFLIDCIGCIFNFYIIPFVAVLFGTGLILIEIKSMFEHAKRRKSSTVNLPNLMKQIIAATTKEEAKAIFEKISIAIENKDEEQNSLLTAKNH